MSKPAWEKKNPKANSTPLQPAEKRKAKAQAKRHGRDKPTLVDNINAQKGRPKKKKKKTGS